MAKNKCPRCGRYKKPWFRVCYPCHSENNKERGLLVSLFIFLYLPSIPTLILLEFGKTFKEAGMPDELLALFWLMTTCILAIFNWQEIDNIVRQWKKKNFF